MVTFAEAFQNWTDFPKGLSVLVVDGDNEILHDIKSKLESYGYMVTSFSSGDEACAALASGTQIFHVALVEATANNSVDGYKILEFSKDLPTIMMSAMENMSIMLDLIAVGAVEFLMKPLSEDKLKNIWQHVVRKVLDSRDTLQPGYLEPGNSASMSAAHDHHQTCDLESNIFEPRNLGQIHHGSARGSHLLRLSVSHERFPAPSTPQLEQGGRMVVQEATLDESPRSHDSTQVYNHKERVDIESNADKLSSSDTSAKVKAESNERADIESNAEKLSSSDTSSKVKTESNETLMILRGIVPVEKEEEDLNQEAKIFCCTIPMLESALHSVDADTVQINDMKLLESKFHREDERLAIDGSKCDEAASLQVEVCETLLSSTENNEHQSFGKNFALHMDVSEDSVERPNADSVGLSQSSGLDQNSDDGKDDIKRNLNDSEQVGKELKCPNSKKKIKVGWTADLHRRFVQAVEYLGVEQAIPSRILEVMKVDGLTRHNVASHLQKYRSHKKHLSTREVEASNWNQNRLNYVRPWKHNGNPTWIQPRPPVQPSFQAHHPQLICPPLHVWGHPTVENLAMHVVPQYMASSNTWHTPDGLVWQHPMVDSWIPGMPIGTPCYGPHMKFSATPPGYPQGEAPVSSTWGSTKHTSLEASTEYELLDLYPSKELLDAVISEALSNPWTPLPLGLKPPSMESVMAELQRQGINTLSPSPCT